VIAANGHKIKITAIKHIYRPYFCANGYKSLIIAINCPTLKNVKGFVGIMSKKVLSNLKGVRLNEKKRVRNPFTH